GSEWLKYQADELNIKISNNPVDVGVRVEVPAIVMKRLTDIIYESKLVYYTQLFDDRVRTFCMCPYGEVVIEFSDGITSVNGHSYQEHRTENTNFALLVSTNFTEPFKEPIAYGKYIANLANILSEGVIIQRLGDLELGRRSTPDRIKHSIVIPTLKEATPGDLSFVLPYRILTDIIEMLKAMDKIAPGVYSKHTLLYGVEVKFYSSRLELSECLETKVDNLFAAGDGAGITRGLIQASASGVIVAEEILKRRNKNK
ncbi:NAD(P)/FAD-dependent oxidoreductase, partial [Candidatus Infernicultor aquiphilus]